MGARWAAPAARGAHLLALAGVVVYLPEAVPPQVEAARQRAPPDPGHSTRQREARTHMQLPAQWWVGGVRFLEDLDAQPSGVHVHCLGFRTGIGHFFPAQ